MSCVHIYCGDGKGKTTASIGLAVRAAGRDKEVVIARFLKTNDSGEVEGLKNIPQVTVLSCERTFGFYWNMSEKEKEEASVYYTELLETAWKTALDGAAEMLILDEIIGCCNHGFTSYERLEELIRERHDALEVVMTGREPSKEIMDIADYISEIRAVKHPFEAGMSAREGIEY